ncbi:MAG TPA: lysophospholipid acyltransferase family protein [Bacillota bacterium]|jgi:1-acyl-sn-glycerol-3-phosphate acyltransferase|nr:lysophospholipid acyltransferase family protein [Peptococcaceae bacterium MAG4]NLW38150.1 1-acyl-sn-glycerol-3-phosphate acyltransferase [Peptococcaceae bacterium]HPZ43017.1 lysophospholipid acyltransferase family protein [Bacillota bacterium]HQD75546.1 lysophospholipid acyltransferase family protein [Bacillota bacterium]HUM57839.1 lysophospholipid acyltransferase family protein [Bacillota bacterium]
MIIRILKFLVRIFLALVRRWEIEGTENIPASGSVVLIANHTSYWDPVVIYCAFKRRVYFMAKAELFKIPVVGHVIALSGAFPVHRDKTDRIAIRTALRLLKEGQVVGIFPEGTRSHSGEMLKPHLGAAMLALKSGAPILPVALSGTRGVWGKVKVRVGKPIPVGPLKTDSRADLENLANLAMSHIAALL